MPVRSLNSSVLKWPDAEIVDRAAREWAALAAADPAVVAVGYLGSYARGDWGVGSDLDLIVIRDSDPPPGEAEPDSAPSSHRLPDVTGLPVPADVLELTTKEWSRGLAEGRRFHTTVRHEAIWVSGRPPDRHGTDRRSMTARVVPLRSAEAGDARTGGTLEERLAAVDALTAEAWRLSGRPFPSYTRATMPVAVGTLSGHAESA